MFTEQLYLLIIITLFLQLFWMQPIIQSLSAVIVNINKSIYEDFTLPLTNGENVATNAQIYECEPPSTFTDEPPLSSELLPYFDKSGKQSNSWGNNELDCFR